MEFADQKMKKYKNTRIPEMPMSKLKKKKENSPSSKMSLCGAFMVRAIIIKFQIDIQQKTRTKIFITLISSYLEDTNKNKRRHF